MRTMLMSRLLGERYRENPGEASLVSHRFLLRGGYVRQVANGIYSLLPPGRRVAMKIERILREEMDAMDGQEVLMPVVMPAELWKESGRFDTVGDELLRMKDRTGHDMLLGMTHEEASVQLTRGEAVSHVKYPFMIYQIQTKFRDEPRSRGGLIRVREFTMKDAYSFHASIEDLERHYGEMAVTYHRIFKRVGLPQVISVGSDTGMMGGKVAHEYMLLTEAGEDSLIICPDCGYKANLEVAVSARDCSEAEEETRADVHTPGMKDIASLASFLDVEESRLMKAAVFSVEGRVKPLVVFIRGDLQVNEAKLRQEVGAEVSPWADEVESGLNLGFVGALGLPEAAVDVLYDSSLEGERNLVGGANRPDTHTKGISVPRDLPGIQFSHVAKVKEGARCAECGGTLALRRGIEVGNIFQLGSRYTESMNMTFADTEGQRRNPVMGCYGIGVGRLVACLVEACHDDFGPIWPVSVAPWQVHICQLNQDVGVVGEIARSLYEKLGVRYEVLMDDRGTTAGIQFADADLLGVPVRVIVSKRNVEKGEVEIATRDKRVRKVVQIDQVEAEVAGILQELSARY